MRTKAPGPMIKPLSQEAYSIYRHRISISTHGVFVDYMTILQLTAIIFVRGHFLVAMTGQVQEWYQSTTLHGVTSHKTTIVIFTSDTLKSHFALAEASLRSSGRIPRNTSFQILPNIPQFDVKLSDSLTASSNNSSSKKKED